MESRRQNTGSEQLVVSNEQTSDGSVEITRIDAEASALYWRFFETVSSRRSKTGSFNTPKTILIPDVVIITSLAFLLTLTAILDRVMLATFLITENNKMAAAFLGSILLFGVVMTVVLRIARRNITRRLQRTFVTDVLRMFFIEEPLIIATFLGLDGLFYLKCLVSSYRSALLYDPTAATDHNPLVHCNSQQLSALKASALVQSITKAVPLLYFLSIYWAHADNIEKYTGLLMKLCLSLNIVTLALSVSATLPLRKTPSVLETSSVIVALGLSRFFAVLSFSGARLMFIRISYHALGMYSIIFHLLNYVLAYVLAFQGNSLWRKGFAFTSSIKFGLSAVYTIAYIHPIHEYGNLTYWVFYSWKFVLEIAILYLIADENQYADILGYVVLFDVSLGFLSICYGFAQCGLVPKSTKTQTA